MPIYCLVIVCKSHGPHRLPQSFVSVCSISMVSGSATGYIVTVQIHGSTYKLSCVWRTLQCSVLLKLRLITREKLRILLPLLATVTPSFGALAWCLLATYEGILSENSNPVSLVLVVVRLYLNLIHVMSTFSLPLTHERSNSRLHRIQPTCDGVVRYWRAHRQWEEFAKFGCSKGHTTFKSWDSSCSPWRRV
jgi:hypothetical protein